LLHFIAPDHHIQRTLRFLSCASVDFPMGTNPYVAAVAQPVAPDNLIEIITGGEQQTRRSKLAF
jgi:hypothetical protein